MVSFAHSLNKTQSRVSFPKEHITSYANGPEFMVICLLALYYYYSIKLYYLVNDRWVEIS